MYQQWLTNDDKEDGREWGGTGRGRGKGEGREREGERGGEGEREAEREGRERGEGVRSIPRFVHHLWQGITRKRAEQQRQSPRHPLPHHLRVLSRAHGPHVAL